MSLLVLALWSCTHSIKDNLACMTIVFKLSRLLTYLVKPVFAELIIQRSGSSQWSLFRLLLQLELSVTFWACVICWDFYTFWLHCPVLCLWVLFYFWLKCFIVYFFVLLFIPTSVPFSFFFLSTTYWDIKVMELTCWGGGL